MKGGHVQVGLITSNLWLVSSRFVHCMSVVPVAMHRRIEWCVSQPQSALAFQLAQLRVRKRLEFSCFTVVAVDPVFFIVARLLSRTYTKQFVFKNLIFTTCRTTSIVHHCRVVGDLLIQRIRSLSHKLARREV